MKEKMIKYKSKNGYTGVLYGKSSFIVYGPDGKEFMHTGFRSGDTYEWLVERVEEMPKFREMLSRVKEDDDADKN